MTTQHSRPQIDYDFYRSHAHRLRQEAIKALLEQLAHRLIRPLRREARLGNTAQSRPALSKP